MRAFGVNKRKYLLFIPVLIVAIVLLALIKAPPVTVNRFHGQEPDRVNPLMGWAVDAAAGPESVSIDHSLVYATLTWRDFEPEKGVYDFDTFEEKNHLAAWWAGGKQLVLRFVMDEPSPEDHMDIPDWLYEEMGGDAGTPYENSLGRGFSPNYNNWTLRAAHEKAVAALGRRYDGHSGVAFIEIGSLGHNGTWHTEGVENEWAMPAAEDLLYWAWQYQEAFPHTPLLMSGNYQPARIGELGLYNEHLGDAAKSWDWLDAIEYGGYDYDVGAELRAMPGALETSLSAARIDRSVDQRSLFSDDTSPLLRELSLCRPSYVSGLDPDAAKDGAVSLSAAQSLMGYRLWVREARYASRRRAGYRLKVDLDLRNDGVQPLSQKFPVALSLLREGKTVLRQITSLDIRTVTPGAHAVSLTLDIPRDFRGEYQLGLSVLNPDTMENAVSLAMDCKQANLTYILGSLTVL